MSNVVVGVDFLFKNILQIKQNTLEFMLELVFIFTETLHWSLYLYQPKKINIDVILKYNGKPNLRKLGKEKLIVVYFILWKKVKEVSIETYE